MGGWKKKTVNFRKYAPKPFKTKKIKNFKTVEKNENFVNIKNIEEFSAESEITFKKTQIIP